MIKRRTKNHMVIRTAPEASGMQKQQLSLTKLDHFIVGHGLRYKQFISQGYALEYIFWKRNHRSKTPISMMLFSLGRIAEG